MRRFQFNIKPVMMAATITIMLSISVLPATIPAHAADQVPIKIAGQAPILIGLDADMSSGSGSSGRAIRRGAEIAIDEINGSCAILGRQLKLVIRDHRGNPARGIDNMIEFSGMDGMVAVLGGLHTPVAMAELKIIHEKKLIYLVPWAAGTPVIENGHIPNYAFRVSVRDEYAGGFLIGKALEAGYRKPALLLEQTGWGRSNKASMTLALKKKRLNPAGIFWFNWGVRDLSSDIAAAGKAGADVIILVANAPEGAAVVDSMSRLPEKDRLPIISHWGITGGDFFEKTQFSLTQVKLHFLQTYSFIKPVFADRNERFVKMYQQKYPETQSAADIFSPVGTAHACDLIHLLKKAIETAGTVDRPAVRDALERIEFHGGLVKNYNHPFTAYTHDALDTDDFILAEYNEKGQIVPVK